MHEDVHLPRSAIIHWKECNTEPKQQFLALIQFSILFCCSSYFQYAQDEDLESVNSF